MKNYQITSGEVMTLLVTVTDDVLWNEALDVFDYRRVRTVQEVGEETAGCVVEKAVQVKELEAVCDQYTKLLVFYAPPEIALSGNLKGEEALDIALRNWHEEALALTSFFRSNRSRVRLINLYDLPKASEHNLRALNDLQWRPASLPSLPDYSLEQIALSYLIEKKTELKQALSLLKACSTELACSSNLTDLSSAIVFAGNKSKRQKEERQELTELTKSLTKQLKQSRSELKTERQTKSQEITRLQHKLEKQVERANELTEKLKVSQSEFNAEKQSNTENIEQLHKVQKELEKQVELNNELAEELKSSKSELNVEKQDKEQCILELNSAQADRDKQLQRVSQLNYKLDSVNSKNNYQASLNEMLIEQLHKLQTEFEDKELSYTEVVSRLHQVQLELEKKAESEESSTASLRIKRQELKELGENNRKLQDENVILQNRFETQLAHLKKLHERESKKVNIENRQLSGKLATVSYQLIEAEKQLDIIQDSFLYKASAPVRALKNILKRDSSYKDKLFEEKYLLEESEYFDSAWYLETYKDVKQSEFNACEHYLLHGAAEGRKPSLDFDTDWYQRTYEDVKESGMNPLIHFIRFGIYEGRSPSPKLLENREQDNQ
ncbi:hypothetical protein KL866_15500 [Alteromonas sp. ALT199]|uniref:hypothetical protein n=1 Tax=unclassified Alteromonas TaxID=2614992 RepID=UPI001BEABEA0|nr:hypothetical protein [Alteromonas sp. ALT199]MBT3136480.1 hypothetical protein [Alteromonas sp. ALT199]